MNIVQRANTELTASAGTKEWIEALNEEDLVFLKRFLLASGTLKELARQYGVSYPTLRLRLDRLIQKVKLLEAHTEATPFERTLRALYAEGRLDDGLFRLLLDTHREEQENAR